MLYFPRIHVINTSPALTPLEHDPANCTESTISTKKINFVSKLNYVMGNKAGKWARNGHRREKEHIVEESKALDGDRSGLERVRKKVMKRKRMIAVEV